MNVFLGILVICTGLSSFLREVNGTTAVFLHYAAHLIFGIACIIAMLIVGGHVS